MCEFEIYLEGPIFVALKMSKKNKLGLSKERLLFKRIIAREGKELLQ